MRRPPDKEGIPVTDRDIASSNATLNTVFGGTKQKSWLLGPRAPVRPTPRPTISKPSANSAVYGTAESVLPSPAPSDENSPVLPNSIVSGGAQAQVYNNWNQSSESGSSQRPAVMSSRPSAISTRTSIPQTQTSQFLPQTEATLPNSASTALSASPSVATPQSLADGQTRFDSAPGLRSSTGSAPYATPNITSPPQPLFEAIPSSLNSTTQLRTAQEQVPRTQLLSPSPVSSPCQEMTFDQPPLPSSVLLQRQNQPDAGSRPSQLNPHKRQRIQVPAPSLRGRVALINGHIDSAGGRQNLNNDLERPRFKLLADACGTEDTFYVALHQLFCIWDSPRRDLLASIPDLPSAPFLECAFKIIGDLIRENKGLASNHLKWFIDFPSPLASLLNTSEAYQRTVKNVGQFLGQLASSWNNFTDICRGRGYPPLIDELIQRLGLTSHILQHIMFTATRRNMGIEDDKYGEQMEAIHNDDWKGHEELAARYNTGRPPTEKEIINRNQRLVDRYLIINHHRMSQTRRVSGPMTTMGSPLANSPIAPHQLVVQCSASLGNTPNSAQPQNFPSTDTWHHNQQAYLQQNRINSNPSPTSLLQSVPSRPPSGYGFQAYSSAPSPTSLQGLSMNSPAVQSPGHSQQSFQWSAPSPILRSTGNSISAQPNGTNQFAPSQQHQQEQVMMRQRQQGTAQQQHLAMQQAQLQAYQQSQLQLQQQSVLQSQRQPQQQIHSLPSHAQHQAQLRQPHPQSNLGVQHRQNQQVADQHRQHMATAAQQVLSMNRTAQLRGNADAVDVQQRILSSSNSLASAGQSPASSHSPNPALSRSITSFVPSPEAQNQALNIYTRTPALQRNLIPPLSFVAPLQAPAPDFTALHQASIRSPRLVSERLASDFPEDGPSRRLYQFVKNLVMPPVKIPVSASMSYLEFSISDECFAFISRDKLVGTDILPVRECKRGSLQYRLRCIQSKHDASKCSMSDWVISDTIWPETVFVEINGHQLEIRRKHHHGKDLPIDITQYVIPTQSSGNANRIRMSIPRLRKALKDKIYFVAVEVIEVLQHGQIIEMCSNSQRVPASKTLDAIKKSLAPPPTDMDDDLAMVVSDLSIDLADPFSATIFEIPVRGITCLHRECFDLETFLLTRRSNPKRPDQPSMIDVWKCPLCDKDARPYSLQVDDFLLSVRNKLVAQDKTDVKAILVSADGGWRAKPEPRSAKRKACDGQEDDDIHSSDGEGSARKQQVIGRKNNPHLKESAKASKDVEIIVLDDD